MNMFLVDFQNRKCEFSLFEAVGTTKKQLNRMLDIEIGIYLGGSLVISLLCGSIFSVIVCKRLDIINHCITLKLPWMFLLALAAVLAVFIVGVQASVVICMEVSKKFFAGKIVPYQFPFLEMGLFILVLFGMELILSVWTVRRQKKQLSEINHPEAEPELCEYLNHHIYLHQAIFSTKLL